MHEGDPKTEQHVVGEEKYERANTFAGMGLSDWLKIWLKIDASPSSPVAQAFLGRHLDRAPPAP